MAAKVSALEGTMEIKGRIGDRPWTVTLPIAKAAEGKGLSKLWARRKIADAEVAKTLRKATPEETDKRILALGLDHQLVTRLTSLVAVDKTPSRPESAKLSRADLPLNLPPAGTSTRCSASARTSSARTTVRSRRRRSPTMPERRSRRRWYSPHCLESRNTRTRAPCR